MPNAGQHAHRSRRYDRAGHCCRGSGRWLLGDTTPRREAKHRRSLSSCRWRRGPGRRCCFGDGRLDRVRGLVHRMAILRACLPDVLGGLQTTRSMLCNKKRFARARRSVLVLSLKLASMKIGKGPLVSGILGRWANVCRLCRCPPARQVRNCLFARCCRSGGWLRSYGNRGGLGWRFGARCFDHHPWRRRCRWPWQLRWRCWLGQRRRFSHRWNGDWLGNLDAHRGRLARLFFLRTGR